MKKLLSVTTLCGLALLTACGPSAEDQAKEKAKQDSIDAANKAAYEDSMQAVAEKEKAEAAAAAYAAGQNAAEANAAETVVEEPVKEEKPSGITKGGNAGNGKAEQIMTKGGKSSGEAKSEEPVKPKMTKGGK